MIMIISHLKFARTVGVIIKVMHTVSHKRLTGTTEVSQSFFVFKLNNPPPERVSHDPYMSQEWKLVI